MKRLIPLAALGAFLFLAVMAYPQTTKGPNTVFPGVPSGGCGPSQIAVNNANQDQYNCGPNGWNKIAGGAGTTAFSSITAGTNAHALVIGTGGSLSTSGSGTIAATSAPGSGITGQVAIANGGTGQATAAAALIALFPTAAEVGDTIVCSAFGAGACTAWTLFAGNASGTGFYTQNSSGVPAWIASPIPVANGGTGAATVAAGTVFGNNTASTSAPGFSAAPALGVDNATAGSLTIANGSSAAHTIITSGATTTNTIKGFSVVSVTTDLIECVVTTTVCALTDSGIAVANVLVSGGALGTPSSGNGSNLTALNATQLTTGSVPSGRGVPIEIYTTASSTQNSHSTLGPVTMVTPGTSTLYRFSGYLVNNAAGSGGTCTTNNTLTFTLSYKDVDTGTTPSVGFEVGNLFGVANPAYTLVMAHGTAAGQIVGSVLPANIYAASGTAFTYTITSNAGGNCTTDPTYVFHPVLEAF